MASSTYHTIAVQAANEQGDVTRIEALAGEAGIGPGDLLEWSAGTFLRHNGAGAEVIPTLVALESQTPDGETTFSIDEDYDNGDTVYAMIPKSGDRVYMWLASGETAAAHDLLESDGDGALQVEAAVSDADLVHAIIGRAVVASDASAALARVLVEIT